MQAPAATATPLHHIEPIELKAAERRKAATDADSRHRRADGVYRWFHVHGLPMRDAEGRIVRWFVLQTDLEDRKQAEVRKAAILESALDCIVTIDHEGRISEFARDLATGEAHMIGRRIETTVVHADGREFPVELTITRIPLEGPPSLQAS